MTAPLAPTHLDFVRRMHPYVLKAAQDDAQKLRLLGHSSPVYNSDFFDNSIPQVLAEANKPIHERIAKATGMSTAQVAADWEHLLKTVDTTTKSFLFRLYQSINSEYHSLLNFYLFGQKVFHITDGLAEHLLHTELRLPSQYLNLPFPSCIFVFTSRHAIDALYKTRQAEDADAWNRNPPPDDAPITVSATMEEPRDALPGRRLRLLVWHSKYPHAFMAQQRNLYLPDGWTIEQSLHTDWDTLTTASEHAVGGGINASDAGVEKQDDDLFYTDGLLFYRLIVNSILYLGSSDPEITLRTSGHAAIVEAASTIKSPEKRRKRIQKANRESAFDYSSVGDNVGVVTVDRRSDGDSTGSDFPTAGSAPSIRFMVRGHWRNQPHGEGLASRRLVWIRPYFKGPDMAELVNRPYKAL